MRQDSLRELQDCWQFLKAVIPPLSGFLVAQHPMCCYNDNLRPPFANVSAIWKKKKNNNDGMTVAALNEDSLFLRISNHCRKLKSGHLSNSDDLSPHCKQTEGMVLQTTTLE